MWTETQTYWYQLTPNPIGFLSRNEGLSITSWCRSSHLSSIWNCIPTFSPIQPVPWHKNSLKYIHLSHPTSLSPFPLSIPSYLLILHLVLFYSWQKPLCSLKAPVISSISTDSFCSSDVYRGESGRFRSLPLILKYFLSTYLSRFFFYTNISL